MTWFHNFGAGLNSSAVAVEMIRRGHEPPAAVFFADTGGETPDTYAWVGFFSEWLRGQGWPEVTRVRWIRKKGDHAGRFVSLEEQCLSRHELPSLAYGRKGCSVKWKGQPVDAAVAAHPAAQAAFERGEQVTRVLGYDADEPHRWNRSKDCERFRWWAPLVEWDMGRDECIEVMQAADLPVPRKSACFFCPAMREGEIRELGRRYPALLARALQIEANAELTDPDRGLGGSSRKWSSVVEFSERQGNLWPEMLETPCGCWDG